MVIRRATYDEAKALKQFDVFVGDRRVDQWRGELFVAAEPDEAGGGGDAILGFVSYSSNLFYNRPFIASLVVRETCRRRGVGAALARRVLATYDGLDVWTSTEAWNAAAVGLFGRLGFESRGEVRGLDDPNSIEVFLCRPAGSRP